MANGYIGKISAVVTANTSDLSRRLAAAGKDFDRFAQRLGLSVKGASDSAVGSIDKIFTRYQRLERTFRSALEINLRTEKDINKIRQLISVAEQINKPLGAAASEFEKLGLSVQGAFLPALQKAQGQVELLNRRVNDTGSVSARAFDIVEQSVSRAAAAIQRLGEAQRLVSAGPRADSLAFADPRAFQSLQASAAIRQQASQLPASALADGRVARQVGNLSAVEQRIAEARARLESLQLRPRVDATEVAAARAELDRLLAGAERIRAGIQVRLDAQRALADAASLNTRLDELQENANFVISGSPQNLRQVEAELVRILGRFDELTEAQRQPLGEQFTRVIDALRAGNLPEAIREFESLAASVGIAADETERLARANQQLAIAPDQPPPPSPSTPLGNRLAQQGADRVRRLTGNLNLDSTPVPGVFNEQAQRDIDALAGRVGAVRQQLETLPNSLRTQFIPALQQAAAQLTALQNSPAATAVQIERAAERVRRLEEAAERAGQALAIPDSGRLLRGFSTRQAVGELEAFGQILARIGAQADGPAAQAYDRYAAAVRRAVTAGTTGLPAVRRELELLQVEAAEAAAATGRIGFKSALQDIRRGGDISRAGADRFTLGFQQALFAVDDFFSVTGDLQQRIRAIGNNISQLGFLIGGTKGLFITLGAVLGLQVVAAFLKVRNGGKELEDQTRSLTNALQEQKRSLDAILQSFDQVAGDIADRGLTAAAKRAEELAKRLRDIAREQEKLQRNRLVELDPEVQERRSNQATLQRRLEQSRRPAERVALQSLIDRERRLELAATDRAFAGRGDGGEAFARRQAEEITAVLERQRYFQILAQENTSFSSPAAVRRRAAEQAGLAFGGVDFADSRAVRAAAVRERERLAEFAARPDDFIGNAISFADQPAFPEAQEAVGALELFIRRLDAADQIDRFTQSVVEAANSVDSSLPRTLTQLEQAAENNIGGARASIERLESLSRDLEQQVALARDAFKRFTEGDEAAADAARQARDRAAAITKAIEAEERKAAELDSTRRSLETFSAALDRVSTELANTVAQEARSAADQARRDANQQQGVLDAGLGGRQRDADEAARRRDQLAAEAAEFERRAAKIAADNARARIDFERQAQAGGLGKQAQDLIRRRDEAQGIVANPAAPAAAVINAQTTLDIINTELRQIFEQSGAGQAAAKLADELDKVRAAAAGREELLDRGRDLLQANLQDAVKERDKNADAIIAAKNAELANIQARVAAGLPREQARQERLDAMRAADRAFAENNRNLLDQAAPTILGLFDQVQNAMLQGPSRAALEATDVSTTDGSRELNRLLRGDDAARNQDLVQLQREANRLLQVIADGQVFVAN